MKNNKHNLDLEQLLADVEHAGRDARRREQLSDMIDRMAATESAKHGFWWWSARVAAAACVLFFISTAVRIWFIPTETPAPLVAEATPPCPPQGGTERNVLQGGAESLAQIDSAIAPIHQHRGIASTSPLPEDGGQSLALVDNSAEESIATDIEEFIADAVDADTALIAGVTDSSPALEGRSPSPNLGEEPNSSSTNNTDNTNNTGNTENTDNTMPVALAQAEPQPQEQERPLHKLFSLRFAEPSLMEGNMLAIRIL